MHRVVRYGLAVAGVVVVLLAAVAAYVAALLNGDAVRLRVEASLSRALGRAVTMQHLRLSPWTGSTVADEFQVTDDPAFSGEPFVRARRIYIGLDVRQLLLHRTVGIHSLSLAEPAIRLLRDRNGRWNYASIAPPRDGGEKRRSGGTLPVMISTIAVEAGSVTVQTAGSDGTTVSRTFTIASLQVQDVGAGQTSPFQLAAELPGGGTVSAAGTAGPWSSSGLSRLPVQAHVQASHLQLEMVGLAPTGSPVRGDLRQAKADVRWSSSGLLVSGLTVDSSRLLLSLGMHASTESAVGHTTASVWSRILQQLVVGDATLHADAVELHRAGSKPVQLRDLEATLGRWAPGGRATFRLSTALAGGTLRATGSVRVPTPNGQPPDLDAEISTAHLRLAGSGLLQENAAGSAMGDAVVDSAVHLRAAGSSLQAAGTFRLANARLVHGGQPVPVPLSMPLTGSFRLQQSEHENHGVGTLEALTVQLGGATLHATGSYGWGFPGAPTVRLTVAGDRMPVDAVETALPSVGIVLPEGSRLQGGTLSLALDVQGALTHPEVSGPIQLLNTRLAGYDLGSKLRGLASFTGGRIGSATASGTQLRRLSFTLHSGAGPIVTDHLQAEIVGIGTATGSGSIGPGGTLDYRLTLKLNELIPGEGGPSGLANDLVGALPPAWARKLQGAVRYLSEGPMKNGVPVLVRGTARKPTVTPDLGALLPPERHR